MEENTTTLIPSQPSIESDSDNNHTDDYLQQAIANLTQSFEGELVEMDNSQSNILDIYETAEPEELASINDSSRPKPEDYKDVW